MVCRTARRVPPPPPAQEAEWLFGIPAADALAHPERVLEQGSWRGVLVSAGEKGSGYAFHAPGGKLALSGVVPVLSVDVADTTGAGDAFLAGFLFYMLMAGGLDSLVADPGKVGPARQRGGWARYPRSGVGEEVGGRQFGMATCRAGRGARPLAASVRRPSTIATSIQLAAQPNSAGRGAALAELVRLPGT
jgi:sugar/nucleoside kinase (ribokinase family)